MMTEGERMVWAAVYAVNLDMSRIEGPTSAVYSANEAVEAMRDVAKGMHVARPEAWPDDHARKMLDEMMGARVCSAETCEWTFTHEACCGVPNYNTCKMIGAEKHGPYCPCCGLPIRVKGEPGTWINQPPLSVTGPHLTGGPATSGVAEELKKKEED